MEDGVTVKIKMVCTSVDSTTRWSKLEGGLVREFSATLRCVIKSDCQGIIQIELGSEHEMAKWVPGMEYEVEIGVPAVPPARNMNPGEVQIDEPHPPLNDGGITGMYSDLPLPVGTAGGGVQPVVDEDKPIAYVKRPMLDFDPPRAYPQASTPVSTDLNVDADE